MTDMQTTIEKMAKIRSREDLTLPPIKYLRSMIDDGSGNIIPLNIRYYQVQGIFHLIMINRFLLGDDTGLGKCVVEDTLIQTSGGLKRASAFNPGTYSPDTFMDVSGLDVVVGKEQLPVKRFYYGGTKPTRWFRTSWGFHIEGSLIHPVKDGSGQWKKLKDFVMGEKVTIPINGYFPQTPPRLPICPADVRQKSFNHVWARYVGTLYGSKPKFENAMVYTYRFHQDDLYEEALKELTGFEKPQFPTLKEVIAPQVREWWRSIGICPTLLRERVPDPILQGTRDMVKGFLYGFFAVRHQVQRKHNRVCASIIEERFAKDVHLLLWKVGVQAKLVRFDGWSEIYIEGNALHAFDMNIGWWGQSWKKVAPPFQPRVLPDKIVDKIVAWGNSEKVVVDLEVDHPSHTFLGDGFECHNTLQSIASTCYFWQKNPQTKVIVITIKSAVRQWADEFERFTEGVKVFTSTGTPNKREKAMSAFWEAEGPSVLIMGYGAMLRDLKHYKHWEGYTLIIDEASAIKNHVTQTHRHARFMSSKASRVVGLTATMIENRLTEGWGIFNALVPGLFGNYDLFLRDYCVVKMMPVPKSNRKIPMILGYRNGAIETFKRVIYPYFMGRSKLEVAKELPPLTRRIVHVEMSKVQRDCYRDALEGTLTIVKDGIEEDKETTKLSAITYCQQIVNHPALIGAVGDSGKLDALMELMTEGDLSDNEFKVIIFSKFKAMIDIIMKELERVGIPAVRITGAENEDQRDVAKKSFQDFQSGIRVVCITTASRQGVNLQSAKAIVFYDTPWSAGDVIQLLGRMIRIGSIHDSVLAYHLVAKDYEAETTAESHTIDTHVLGVLNK